MKLCRFKKSKISIGALISEHEVADLTAAGVSTLTELFETTDLETRLANLDLGPLPRLALADVRLLAPVEQQEVWAAGVTYLRSKKARMAESEFSATAYDKVYEAPRPELFFKALAHKVAGPGDPVGIRKDARWSVPEPELVLIINSKRKIVGYSIGNDMSSRDIEGENLLYLPQAKIYSHSCALGPFITVGVSEAEARTWKIRLTIERAGAIAFSGETSVSQIKRSFEELAEYLYRCETFSNGAALLTGTGIVPGDDFTLQPTDLVRIDISGIGTLANPVMEV